MQEFVKAVHKAAVAAQLTGQEHKAEYRNEQTANDQAKAVDGVRQCNCFQAAEDRIDRTNDRGRNTNDSDCSKGGNTKQLVQLKDVYKYLCACVQDVRQHDNNIAEQNDDGNQTTGACIVTLLKELRNGGQAGLQILRHQYECQNNQCDGGGNLPAHRTHTNANSLAIIADKLLSRQVGHQQRTSDNRADQAASTQIVAILCFKVVSASLPPRNDRNKSGKRYKCNRSERHRVQEIHDLPLFKFLFFLSSEFVSAPASFNAKTVL